MLKAIPADEVRGGRTPQVRYQEDASRPGQLENNAVADAAALGRPGGQALLEAVLWHMPAGVIIAEAPSGRLLMGNEQVRRIWRRPFSPAVSIEEYRQYVGFHADGRPYEPREWPMARSIAAGEVVLAEKIEFQRGDGTRGII